MLYILLKTYCCCCFHLLLFLICSSFLFCSTCVYLFRHFSVKLRQIHSLTLTDVAEYPNHVVQLNRVLDLWFVHIYGENCAIFTAPFFRSIVAQCPLEKHWFLKITFKKSKSLANFYFWAYQCDLYIKNSAMMSRFSFYHNIFVLGNIFSHYDVID